MYRIEHDDVENVQAPPRSFRGKYIFIALAICTLGLLTVGLLKNLSNGLLERNPPIIELIDIPAGIGISQVTLKLRVSDLGAGLDEAVVRVHQRGSPRELQRLTQLKGIKDQQIVIDIDGENSGLQEGLVTFEVRAFDRSFWSNAAELSIPLVVDFKKPKLELISSQHNARSGGSQLVFYRVFDEHLALSGVKVGKRMFAGYPASAIDKSFTDPAMHVAIYALALNEVSDPTQVKLYAEDRAGNAVSSGFYNKIAERAGRETKVTLSEEFMQKKIASLAANSKQTIIQNFSFVNEKMRLNNDEELVSLLTKTARQEANWTGQFLRQNAVVQQSFGDKLTFFLNGNPIGKAINLGEDVILPREEKEVLSVSNGVVAFVQDLGVYGLTLGVDHGLGVVSVYSHLASATVKKGDPILRGQALGLLGSSGLARNPQLHFEIRIQGVPVDPKEWWEANWYASHVEGKINDVKKSLGISYETK